MIRYTLKCEQAHVFESWFQNAGAFETLRDGGHIACPECGAVTREKAVMAPRVRTSRAGAPADPAPPSDPAQRPLAPADKSEKALAALRSEIERNSDYVGTRFATEARRMHDGDIPQRSIHGEARLDEARKLLESGVPIAPLPFMPQRKLN